MPTASKAVAAICLAIVTWWLLTTTLFPLLGEGYGTGYYLPIMVVLGALTGWRTIGPRAPEGLVAGVTFGFTGGVVLYVLAIFVAAAGMALDYALQNRYRGPVEAFEGMLKIALDYVALSARADVMGFLLAGAVGTGVIASIVGRFAR
ncbi:MAG: hypothetical protein CSA72_08780 [Rhodobacterales bacterium]|nr:MAG: hypothetical protein CSA72_08780 [Rhodobacterales bacterium]